MASNIARHVIQVILNPRYIGLKWHPMTWRATSAWPCTVAEHVIRYRKKVEKDEDYIKTINNLGTQVEAGPDSCCSPRHLNYFESSTIDLNVTLWRGATSFNVL